MLTLFFILSAALLGTSVSACNGRCPDGWELYNNMCYKFFGTGDPKTFDEAMAVCFTYTNRVPNSYVERHGQLASIHNQTVLDHLFIRYHQWLAGDAGRYRQTEWDPQCYVGLLADSHGGHWLDTSSFDPTLWLDGEPNNMHPTSRGAISAGWNGGPFLVDVTPNLRIYFLCQLACI